MSELHAICDCGPPSSPLCGCGHREHWHGAFGCEHDAHCRCTQPARRFFPDWTPEKGEAVTPSDEAAERRGECHEDMGSDPCGKPAVGTRIDPEYDTPYPVCRGHLRPPFEEHLVPFCPDCGRAGVHGDECDAFPGEPVTHGNFERVVLARLINEGENS